MGSLSSLEVLLEILHQYLGMHDYMLPSTNYSFLTNRMCQKLALVCFPSILKRALFPARNMFPCTNKATRYIRSLWMILLVNVITTKTTFLKSLVAGTVYHTKLTLNDSQ